MAPAMSVALRTICYAGSRDQVGACHSQAHSVTVVGCLSPCDTTVRRKQRDTHHGRLLHRVNVHRSLLICCSDLLQHYTDSPSRWPGRRYWPQRFDSAVSHAAAAHAPAEITEMNAGSGGVGRGGGSHTHTPIDSHSRHERDPTNSDEVITADTAWRLEAGSGKTDESTTCSSERPQVRMCKPPVLNGGYRGRGAGDITRASRSDSQTLIMVSTSCSRSVWLLSTSLLTFPPATFWQSQISLIALAWTSSLTFLRLCVSLSHTHTQIHTHFLCNG